MTPSPPLILRDQREGEQGEEEAVGEKKRSMEWLTKRNPAETNGVSHYGKERCGGYFRMPLHYPRYTKADYQTMPEWKVDCLLREYGLPVFGDLSQKRDFAMGAFLWTR